MIWSEMSRTAKAGRIAAIGCLTAPLLIAILALVGTAAGAPPEHDVITMGGRSIAYQTSTPYPQAHFYGTITPTTSLDDARCQAWRQAHGGACPDATTLAATYWPGLEAAPQTLHVGVLAYCGLESSHFNLELAPSSLILHCHASVRWVNLERPLMGVVTEPITDLLVVSTANWKPGHYTVYREDRLERWLFDQVTTTSLGAVAI